jgi:Holliday junction DNA helicase RuvA
MIAYLQGRLHSLQEDAVVIDVQGVGYQVFVSERSLLAMPPLGDPIALSIVTIVREDALHLYGFSNALELKIFKMLNNISGIGPRQSIHLLSNSSPEELIRAVNEHDTGYLESLRGIGHKTAEKIILELKAPVAKLLKQESVPLQSGAENQFRYDLVAALTQLGYRRAAIEEAWLRLPLDKQRTLQQAIRECLKMLSVVKSGGVPAEKI